MARENATGRLLVGEHRPFEIWSYTQRGVPLFPDRETGTTVTGLKFVFVDETNVGHYVLQYSSDFIGY